MGGKAGFSFPAAFFGCGLERSPSSSSTSLQVPHASRFSEHHGEGIEAGRNIACQLPAALLLVCCMSMVIFQMEYRHEFSCLFHVNVKSLHQSTAFHFSLHMYA